MATFAYIIGSAGAIQLSKHVDLMWIFIGMGSIILLTTILVGFGFKDIVKEKELRHH